MMKILLATAWASLLFATSSLADDGAAARFLQEGHSYEFVYALDEKTVSEEHLPRLVIVKSHAGGSWYLVRPIDRNIDYWINLTNVVGITEFTPQK